MVQPNKEGSDPIGNARFFTAPMLIKAFWQSPHRLKVYIATIIILLMTIAIVGVDVALNYWYNYFYNALQAYDRTSTLWLLVVFFSIATVYILLAVYRYYISQLFGLKWRRWLTERLLDRWLAKRGYYYLETFDKSTDNPDQRIQEDISSLVLSSIDLAVGLVAAVATFFAFIYVLWTLSGTLILPLGPLGKWRISGYLVWVSLIYSFVGTLITLKIGRPLIGLNFEQQRREATFRFAAIDLRSHAENVALYRGEDHQKSILDGLFNRVLDNWYAIILRQKLLLWFTAGFNQISVVLPLIVALPNYFGKVFLLGGLIQSMRAFSSVQDSLSFIINSYTGIAQWRAVTQRLTTFLNHLEESEEKAQQEDKVIRTKEEADQIIAKDITINKPDNELLLKNINEKFTHGKHYLIKGASGIGKSTFLRTIAGIWPYAMGEMTLPKDKQIMYLPQRPYMPIGTLAEAILFPDKKHPHLAAQLESCLRDCRLESFIPRLNEVASWSQQLSPGEQQRIAFARVLLHKPDWAFLDESTSMLDVNNEKYLYELLRTKLPNCSIVSIGHRPTIEDYHDHVIDMAKYSV